MQRTIIALAASAAAIGMLTSAVQAQVNPPAWWGQQDPNSAYGCFDFSNPNDPYHSDDPNGFWPFGTPTGQPSDDVHWEAGTTAHPGVVGVGPGQHGGLSIYYENDFRPDWVKEVWFQVVFYENNPLSDVSATLMSSNGPVAFSEVDTPLADGWTMATCTATIFPQADWEVLDFQLVGGPPGTSEGAWIDEVCFGTICTPVPEPASLAALGFGAMALVRRRSRSRR